MPQANIVLGSRSPRRQELLAQLVGPDQLIIRPPRQTDEQGFDGLNDLNEIRDRLMNIVRAKMQDVQQHTAEEFPDRNDLCWLTADTIVIVRNPTDDRPIVLGQPDPNHWQDEVRTWLTWYAGTSHEVWTGLRIARHGRFQELVVRTAVRFTQIDSDRKEWYIRTKESLGKAGGYAIQGAAAMFVEGLSGSLTNVIGLPMNETAAALQKLDVVLRGETGNH